MKYLFKALFENNEIYEQNPADISIINPEKSCFFDVLEKQKSNKLLAFALYDKENNEYLVDLRNGQFEINGKRIKLHEEDFLSDFRLIYFRKNTITFTQGIDKTNNSVEFCIGWQTTVNGINYKKTVFIN
jgi:hypothetical protein